MSNIDRLTVSQCEIAFKIQTVRGVFVCACMSDTHTNLPKTVIYFIAAQGKTCHLDLKHLDRRTISSKKKISTLITWVFN